MSVEPSPLVQPFVKPQPHPEFPLWHYVWKLLRLRMLIFYNGFRRARLRRKIGTILVGLVMLVGFVGVFALSWLFLSFLRSPELAMFVSQTQPFLDSVPVLILAGAFLMILLTSFGVLLQALYLANDMDFLLSAPVPIRAVFITKLLQAIVPNLSLIALFTLPVLLGLGAAGRYNVLYYPMVVLVLAGLALAAAGISSLLVMTIVRVVPARRVAEVLGFLGAILSITCSQAANLMNLSERNITAESLPFNGLARFSTPYSPLNWAGHGLVALGEGHWAQAALYLLLTLGLTAGLFYLSLQTAERLYYTGWASIQAVPRRKKAARGRRTPTVGTAEPAALAGTPRDLDRKAAPGLLDTFATRILPVPVRALVRKDFHVLRRDLRNMSQIVAPLIFGVVYAVMLLGRGGEPPAGRGEAPAWFMTALKSAMDYGSVAIALFVGWSLLSRLALMGISMEGRSYWMLKSAPLKTRHLLTAKYIVAYLPPLVLGIIFLALIAVLQKGSPSALLYSVPVVALILAGATGINLAFGVIGVNLQWEDPRRLNAGSAGCISAIVTPVYMLLGMAVFFGPPILALYLQLPEVAGQAIGLAIGGVYTLVCAILPPVLVSGRVSRIGEA